MTLLSAAELNESLQRQADEVFLMYGAIRACAPRDPARQHMMNNATDRLVESIAWAQRVLDSVLLEAANQETNADIQHGGKIVS